VLWFPGRDFLSPSGQATKAAAKACCLTSSIAASTFLAAWHLLLLEAVRRHFPGIIGIDRDKRQSNYP
jgi:hypothetical protein